MLRAVAALLLLLTSLSVEAQTRNPPAQSLGPNSTAYGAINCAPGKVCDLSQMTVTPQGGSAATLPLLLKNYLSIDGGGVLRVLNGPTLGSYQNNQYISQPYNIQLGGPGSTGPIDGMSAASPDIGAVALALSTRIQRLPLIGADFGIRCDGVFDDAPKIRQALAVARFRVNPELQLPSNSVCMIGSTVSAANWSNVKLTAAGVGTGAGPGMQIQSAQDGAVLKWIGPAGGTMVDWQTTDTSNCVGGLNVNCAFTTSSSIQNLVLDGNGLAATALKIRGLYRSDAKIKIRNVTTAGVDIDVNTTVPAGTGGGDVQQNRLDIHEDLTTSASVNAKGVVAGVGTSYQNTHHNFLNLYILHQAGTGLELGNADSNVISAQIDRTGMGTAGVAFGLGVTGSGIPGGATVTSWDATTITLSANATATARIEAQFSTGSYMEANITSGSPTLTNVRTGWSVDFKASPINGFGPGQVTQSARANIFPDFQGAAGVVARQGFAATQSQRVLAAYNNRILNWTAESTGINYRIEGQGTPYGATLSWCIESGSCFNQTRFETSYEGAFLLAGVDSPRAGTSFPVRKQFATNAEFGSDRPVYILGPNPGFGYNLFYQYAGYTYGPGSASNYGAVQNFDTGTGRLSTSTAPPGNAGGIVSSLTEVSSVAATGNRLGPSLSSDPTCSFDGQTYFNTTVKKLKYCVTPNTWNLVGQ